MIENIPKISVVIPVKNEEEKITKCLKAIFDQTIKPLEVIVVDGYSTDKTEDHARKFLVNYLFEDNQTRGGACQKGVENAKGDFITFTDADCIPPKNWLEKLVKEFDDQNIVGVGGGIKNIGNNIWEKSINFAMQTFLGSANSIQGRIFKDKRIVKSISGSNSMYRKKDIFDVGGFNIKLITAEDTELNNKLLKKGKLIYTPDAFVLHNPRRGLRKFVKRMYQYGYGRGKSRLLDLQIIPPILLPALIVSTIFTSHILLNIAILYFFIVGFIGLKFSLQERNIIYSITIPIVYIFEHISYTIGFWKGLLL